MLDCRGETSVVENYGYLMGREFDGGLSRGRFRGCLLGLAVGDALGTTVEFSRPGSFTPVTDMVGGGPFALEPGQWTDDTSMALCLAESIVKVGWDPADQMRGYLRWWRQGHLSSTGRCFDIGIATREALGRFEANGEPFAGSADPSKAGNGSVMRLAAVPMRWPSDAETLRSRAADSSRTTHAAAVAVDGCCFLAALVAAALRGVVKEELLASGWYTDAGTDEIVSIAQGSYKGRSPAELPATGYVVHTLEAALWALLQTGSFAEGALLAVNLGNDADTTGAVYGQLAGALYGEDGIPARWRSLLALHDTIASLADRLHELAIA